MNGRKADLIIVDDPLAEPSGETLLSGPLAGAWFRKAWSQPINHGPECKYEVQGGRLALVCRCSTPHTTPGPEGSKDA